MITHFILILWASSSLCEFFRNQNEFEMARISNPPPDHFGWSSEGSAWNPDSHGLLRDSTDDTDVDTSLTLASGYYNNAQSSRMPSSQTYPREYMNTPQMERSEKHQFDGLSDEHRIFRPQPYRSGWQTFDGDRAANPSAPNEMWQPTTAPGEDIDMAARHQEYHLRYQPQFNPPSAIGHYSSSPNVITPQASSSIDQIQKNWDRWQKSGVFRHSQASMDNEISHRVYNEATGVDEELPIHLSTTQDHERNHQQVLPTSFAVSPKESRMKEVQASSAGSDSEAEAGKYLIFDLETGTSGTWNKQPKRFVPNTSENIENIKPYSIYLGHELTGIQILKKILPSQSYIFPPNLPESRQANYAVYQHHLKDHITRSTVTYIKLANMILDPPLYKTEAELERAQLEAVSFVQNACDERDKESRELKMLSPDERDYLKKLTSNERAGVKKKASVSVASSNQLSHWMFLIWMKATAPGNLFKKLSTKKTEKRAIMWQKFYIAHLDKILMSSEWTYQFESDEELKRNISILFNYAQILTYKQLRSVTLRWKGY